MNETLKKYTHDFHAQVEDGRIHAEIVNCAGGLAVKATIMRGEAIVSSLMRYSKDGVSNLDSVTDEAILDALILAGIKAESHTQPSSTTSDEPKKRGKKTSAPVVPAESDDMEDKAKEGVAGETKEEDTVVTAPADDPATDVSSAVEDASAKPNSAESSAETPQEPAGEPSDEPEDDGAMTVDEARNVILETKTDAKTLKKVAASSIAPYVGKPMGELADGLPSFVAMLAARAGTSSSMLSAESEEAVKVLAAN